MVCFVLINRQNALFALEKSTIYRPTQFNFNAFYQESEVMYFGTTKGLVAFRPSEIKYEEKFKPVFFTDFQLYNGEVKMEDTLQNSSIRSQIAL